MQSDKNFMQYHPYAQLIRPLSFIGGLFLLNLLFLSLGLYEKYAYLDDIFHFLGGSSIAFFILRSMSILLPQNTTKLKITLTILLTFIIALLWEVMEFSCDTLLGTQLQMGVIDTIIDLVIGTTGAACVTVGTSKIFRTKI